MFPFGFRENKKPKIYPNLIPHNLSNIAKKPTPQIQRVTSKRKQTIFNNVQLAKNQIYANQALMEKINHFIGSKGNVYLTFGGVGDLILLLAECYKDPSAKVIFFANGGSDQFGKKFLELFGLNYFIHPNIMGGKIANEIVDFLKSTGRLSVSAHLADDLDFDDYRKNPDKYKSRMTLKTNWKNEIGFAEELNKQKLCILCPSGSVRAAYKQRFLHPDEYQSVVSIYLKNGYKVFSTGSDNDIKFYPEIRNDNHFWLTADKIICKNKTEKISNFKKFLQIINSATVVFSVDTWIKTYSALAQIKTRVVQNRFNDIYEPVGHDPSDFIFLNTDFYPTMQIHPLPNLVLENCFCLEDAEYKLF